MLRSHYGDHIAVHWIRQNFQDISALVLSYDDYPSVAVIYLPQMV